MMGPLLRRLLQIRWKRGPAWVLAFLRYHWPGTHTGPGGRCIVCENRRRRVL